MKLGAGAMGAMGIARQGGYNQAVANYNARMLELKAGEVEQMGTEAKIQRDIQAKHLKGAQKVVTAGRGVDVATGTPARLQADVDLIAEIDKLNIDRNIEKRASALRTQADFTRLTGEMQAEQAELGAVSTLIGSGAEAFQMSGLGEKPSGTKTVHPKWYTEPQYDLEDYEFEFDTYSNPYANY